jgi:hypothetical protein
MKLLKFCIWVYADHIYERSVLSQMIQPQVAGNGCAPAPEVHGTHTFMHKLQNTPL